MLVQAGAVLGGLMLTSAVALAGLKGADHEGAEHSRTMHKETLLRVTGRIAGGTAALDREALHALPPVELVTSTVVTDGKHSFTGFLMRDLLERLDAEGSLVTAVALNDYAVDIPMADFYDFDVIVAYRMDGTRIGRDDKGPLWIVYPRDDHEALQDIRYDYRWVWQLYQLDIR